MSYEDSTSFFEDSSSSSCWSSWRTSLRFWARLSLDFELAKNAASWDFWFRNNDVSGLAGLRNSGWLWNQFLTLSGAAFEVSNCVHHFTKACLCKGGYCLLFSVFPYLYCHEKIHDKAKLEKYIRSAGILDSWLLNNLLNCWNPCWSSSGNICGIGPK